MIPLGRYLGFIAISLTPVSQLSSGQYGIGRETSPNRTLLLLSLYSLTWIFFSYTYTSCLGFFFFQQAQCGLDLRHITVVELVGVFPTLIGRIGAKVMPPALALQLR